jgi:hypothetical protein
MVYNTELQDILECVLKISKQCFENCTYSDQQVSGCPLERANLNHCCVSSSHLRMETDPVFETKCFIVFRMRDDGQNPNDSEKYAFPPPLISDKLIQPIFQVPTASVV